MLLAFFLRSVLVWFLLLMFPVCCLSSPAPEWQWGSAASWLSVTWCPAVAPPSFPSWLNTWWQNWPRVRLLQWLERTSNVWLPSAERGAIELVRSNASVMLRSLTNGNFDTFLGGFSWRAFCRQVSICRRWSPWWWNSPAWRTTSCESTVSRPLKPSFAGRLTCSALQTKISSCNDSRSSPLMMMTLRTSLKPRPHSCHVWQMSEGNVSPRCYGNPALL